MGGPPPGGFEFPGCPDCPAERVSWNDIAGPGGFIETLNGLTSGNYRLPTDAEWEYACRSGQDPNVYRYYNGWAYDGSDGGDPIGDYAWYWDNSGGSPQAVGFNTLPNGWGLYDMHGNVWEWVQDWHQEDYFSQTPYPHINPICNNASSGNRVFRGGSWEFNARLNRSASRGSTVPTRRGPALGFRLARDN